MRAVVQRVRECSVVVENEIIGHISSGLLVYLGVEKGDTEQDTRYMAEKISGLRLFEDSQGKMNLSVKDTENEILVVSQFTLCADTRKGRRPSYNNAETPESAERLYLKFIRFLREKTIPVETGKFQTFMNVKYTNAGPVTILVDPRKRF